MPRGDQLSRQWTLVRLLTGKLGRSLAQLRAELGVTKRTVQRDIENLERSGFPIVSESRDGTIFWRFIEGFSAESPVALTLTELMALYYSRGLLRPLQGTEIHDSIASAMQKIGATLPAESLRLMRELEGAVAVSTSGWKDYSRSREIMDKLTKAVLHRYTARIEHTAVGYKEPVSREVDPYKLWYVSNGLYLVAYDHRSEDLRVFALERINSVSLTNRRFDSSGFDFEKFAQSAFVMIGGEAQEVEIRFSKQQAPYVRERTWHPSQSIETKPNGSIILRLRVADLGEVKRWLIGFGADALVLRPAALRHEITAECARMSRRRVGPK
jgi:predicted DNA-binding transcriptional regulator YafY